MFTAVNYLSLFSPSLMVDDIDNHIGLVVSNFVFIMVGFSGVVSEYGAYCVQIDSSVKNVQNFGRKEIVAASIQLAKNNYRTVRKEIVGT